MNLNAKQLHTLRHMLGINTPNDRIPKPYRNYAAVISGNPEYIKLERLGAIREYRVRIPIHYAWYECTQEGRSMAMKSHRDIAKQKPSVNIRHILT